METKKKRLGDMLQHGEEVLKRQRGYEHDVVVVNDAMNLNAGPADRLCVDH